MLKRGKSAIFSLVIFIALITGAGIPALIASTVPDRQEQSIPISATASTTGPRQQEEGNVDTDQMTVTLSDNPIQGDPLIGSTFSGTTFYSDDFQENLTAGFLTDKKEWYVGIGVPDGAATTVECHFGIHWQADEDASYSTGSDIGCVGDLGEISQDPTIRGLMEPSPVYEGELITGWTVNMFDSLVATITFAEGKAYQFGGSSIFLEQKQ
jgi:hypothetical protein